MNQWSKKLNFTWDVHQDKDWGMVPKSGWYSSSCLIDRFSVCLSRSKYFHVLFFFCFPFLIFLYFAFQLFIFQLYTIEILYKYLNIIRLHLVIFLSLFIFIDTYYIHYSPYFAFHLLTNMFSYLQLLFMCFFFCFFLFLFLFLFSFFFVFQ